MAGRGSPNCDGRSGARPFAVARGIYYGNTCKPDCAAGHFIRHRTMVCALGLRVRKREGVYTYYVFRDHGKWYGDTLLAGGSAQP